MPEPRTETATSASNATVAHWRQRAKSEPLEALRALETSNDLSVGLTHWIQGIALFELSDTRAAIGRFDAALAVPTGRWRPHVRISRYAAVAAIGDVAGEAAEGLAELSQHADSVVAAMARSQLGFVQLRQGELHSAEELLRSAVDALRDVPDFQDALARVLGNLGSCLLFLERRVESIPFHQEAYDLAAPMEYRQIQAGALQNLGWAMTGLGKFPEAIDYQSQARAMYDTMSGAKLGLSSLLIDLADTHLLAGLIPEAVRFAEDAVGVLREGTNIDALGEAELRHARCLLEAGHHEAAHQKAIELVDSQSQTMRSIHAARAQMLAWESELAGGSDLEAVPLPTVQEVCDQAWGGGWSRDVETFAQSLAQRLTEQRREIPSWLLLPPTDNEPDNLLPSLNASMRSAIAAFDDQTGARFERSIGAARTAIAQHSAELQNPELRAGTTALSDRFDRLESLRCVRRNDLTGLLRSQVGAAVIKREALADMKPDERATAILEEIRTLTRDHPPGTERDSLIRQCEDRFSAETWTPVGAPASEKLNVTGAVDETIGRVCDTAAESALITITPVGQDYVGLRIDGHGPHLDTTVSCAEVARIATNLRRTLLRLVLPGRSDGALQSERSAVYSDAAQLGQLLLPELNPDVALTLIPPAELADLPWSLIAAAAPSVTIAPTLAHVVPGPIVLDQPKATVAIGPDLPRAVSDIEAVVTSFGSCDVLSGPDATASAVLGALESCDLVHIAAHGRYRTDAPRFSSLDLADGPVMIHDLTEERAHAQLVVLAACDGGRSGSAMNTTGAAGRLIDVGVGAVLAPTCAVPDSETATVIRAFYEHLPTMAVGAAIDAVARSTAEADPRLWATAQAFQLFGVADCFVSPGAADPLSLCDPG